MDIERSQRLIKFANCIKEMVDYKEISEHLLQSKVLTLTDHEQFISCVSQRGNPSAMEDLIHLLGLRRRGFNVFIEALRCNDYIWLANQMDPPKSRTDSSSQISKSIFPISMMGIGRRKSRRSQQRLSSETIFTSYRASYPMDLGPLRQPQQFTTDSFRIASNPCSSFINASMDSLKLDDVIPPPTPERCSNLTGFVDDDRDDSKPSYDMSNTAIAIIYNIPEPEVKSMDADVQIVSQIAEELKFPGEFLKGLKTIRIGRVDKGKIKIGAGKCARNSRPLKVKFKSSEARNKFISLIQSQKSAFDNSILHQMEVAPYKGKNITLNKSVDELDSFSVVESKKRHWYQKNFLKKKLQNLSKPTF